MVKISDRFSTNWIKRVEMRSLYNKKHILHWAYLDYLGTDKAIKNSIKNTISGSNTKLKALDVGCGPNQVHRIVFENYGYEYFGIDITGSGPIIQWDGNTIPVADASMDYVLISWTLQNITNQISLISEVHRVLVKKGKVFIVNTVLSPVSLSNSKNAIQSSLEKGRLQPEGMRQALVSGFENIEMEHKGGIGQTLGWNLHIIWWKFYRNTNRIIRIASWVGFPLFILLTLVINLTGIFYNLFDSSGRYSSYFVVEAQKSD